MLKRSIITIVAAACLALPLAACAAKPTQVMVPPTATPIPTTEPSATATVTSTPAPTPTATPITFESTVITSIMCQTGPGEDYTRIGYLKEGEVYTTYARDSGTTISSSPSRAIPPKLAGSGRTTSGWTEIHTPCRWLRLNLKRNNYKIHAFLKNTPSFFT